MSTPVPSYEDPRAIAAAVVIHQNYTERSWDEADYAERVWALGTAAAALRAADQVPEVGVLPCPHWAPGRITFREGCTACEGMGMLRVPRPPDEPGRVNLYNADGSPRSNAEIRADAQRIRGDG